MLPLINFVLSCKLFWKLLLVIIYLWLSHQILSISEKIADNSSHWQPAPSQFTPVSTHVANRPVTVMYLHFTCWFCLFVCLFFCLFGVFLFWFFFGVFFPLDWRRGGGGLLTKFRKSLLLPPPLLFFLNGYSSSGKLGLTDWSWNIPQTILIIK